MKDSGLSLRLMLAPFKVACFSVKQSLFELIVNNTNLLFRSNINYFWV